MECIAIVLGVRLHSKEISNELLLGGVGRGELGPSEIGLLSF